MNDRTHNPGTERPAKRRKNGAHATARSRSRSLASLPSLPSRSRSRPTLDDGDGVPFCIAIAIALLLPPGPTTGDPCPGCSTISRLPRGGDADLDPIRSSSAGLVPDDGGERVAPIGGRWPPWLESPAPSGRGCGGSVMGNCGLGGYDDRALSGAPGTCRMSGECDVGCWRKGIGLRRVPGPGVGVGRPFVGGDTRWLMLPTRERLTSGWSSGPGLSGRLFVEGEVRDETDGRRTRCC